MAEDRCHDGVLRLRMERTTFNGAVLNGNAVARVVSRYLDGVETIVLRRSDGTDEGDPLVQKWGAVPARTQDVLDFRRLEGAATRLTQQMAAYGPGNRPSAEQVASWLLAYGNLQQWRKEAEARMVGAEGQVNTVGIVLRQFVGG
ncbi:hypothetical protein [Pedococcus bigeumensis]|uniref:hypothetical protein n=1 Tax=Pedococcus bigeumensis TaxID=433644 RepID=UPI0031D7E0A7